MEKKECYNEWKDESEYGKDERPTAGKSWDEDQ